jgi:hypothetical protein
MHFGADYAARKALFDFNKGCRPASRKPLRGRYAILDSAQQPARHSELARLIVKAVKAGVAPCGAGCLDGLGDQKNN